jgi:hypothetical protein
MLIGRLVELVPERIKAWARALNSLDTKGRSAFGLPLMVAVFIVGAIGFVTTGLPRLASFVCLGAVVLFMVLLTHLDRHDAEIESDQPIRMRERLDALAQVMALASSDLRNIAERVEAETVEIAAEIDQQLARAEAEVRARQAKFDELVAKSMQYEQTAALHEEQAQAVAKFFRRQVEEVTEAVERKSRRREWGLGTFGGFAVGILAIMAARYFLGF